MKKVMVVLIGLMLISGWAFGYTTFQEAIKDGIGKFYTSSSIDVRAIFTQALGLAVIPEEETEAKVWFANTYFFADKNYQTAITEYKKVVAVPKGHVHHQGKAYIWMGDSYRALGDNVNAITSYISVLTLRGTLPEHSALIGDIKTAFTKLSELDANWNMILTTIGTPNNWSGFYCRAIVKEQLSDFSGAKDDLVEAIKRTESLELLKELGQKLERVKLVLR